MFYNNDHKCVLEFLSSKFIDGHCCRNVSRHTNAMLHQEIWLRIFVFVDDPMHFIQIRLGYGEAFGFGLGLDD